MRLAFDARAAGDLRGIARYAGSLLEALRAAGHDVVETSRPRRADVFHSPWIDGAPLRPRIPTVVTLHDVVPLKRRGEYLRTGMRFRMRYLAVSRAHAVIVPTQAVAAEAEEHLGLDPARLHVVPEAAAPAFRPHEAGEVAAVRERLGLPDDYLLWVGGLERPDPRKRVAELSRARRSLPLVLAGPTSPWVEELDGVLLTHALSDPDLAAVYAGARALVFPSDDEGYGLPPVEALACGTPVAACDVPALREVLGDRAAWAAADDLDGLVAAAESLDRPAPPPLARTWDDVAEETVAVYESLLS